MNVTFRTIQNATVSVDNTDVSGRDYDIKADAFIQSGTVHALYNGTVTSTTDGAFVCGFTDNTDRSLNINYGSAAADRVAALEAVTDFCASARATDSELTVTLSAN